MTETKRPISEGAEEVLNKYFPVLDAGFCALVDYMGTDNCIEAGARVSYAGGGTRKVNQTEGLIRYLRRHWHTSPSELVQVKFHMCAPIFVLRQFFRHRTQCLAGDSQLFFAKKNISIKEIYEMWKSDKELVKDISLKSCDEQTGKIYNTRIKDVWKSGVKPLFKVMLENGNTLTMSKDHRCFTKYGWNRLEDAVKLDNNISTFIENQSVSFGVSRKFAVISGAEISYSKVIKIEYVGEQETYDIEVDGPYHNFIANGMVVHNSANEMSGRYSLMPMLFYTPTHEQFQKQSKNNNQGRDGAVEIEKYKAAVARWNELRKENVEFYTDMVEADIAREIARIDLPLSTYSQLYFSMNLHNLFHFMKLRSDGHAQYEIQAYSNVMAGIVKKIAPLSFKAWIDYNVESESFSKHEMSILKKLISVNLQEDGGIEASGNGQVIVPKGNDMNVSVRELKEFFEKFQEKKSFDFELDMSQAKEPEYFEKMMLDAVPKVDIK